MLYPYDVVRLKNRLGISSDLFLDRYVDLVLRPGDHFPEVLLKMSENDEKTCPFLTASGCAVYPDRPDVCRTFPVERGMFFQESGKPVRFVYLFRPPDFCMGKNEKKLFTPKSWIKDQEAEAYQQMTAEWATLRRLFENDPWEGEGPECPKAKMAFMAAYNMDRFREFVFNSTFLKRYTIKADVLKKIRASDEALMKLGFEWIKFYIRGIQSRNIRLRQKLF
jgi:Fe-S-cluster containining protein